MSAETFQSQPHNQARWLPFKNTGGQDAEPGGIVQVHENGELVEGVFVWHARRPALDDENWRPWNLYVAEGFTAAGSFGRMTAGPCLVKYDNSSVPQRGDSLGPKHDSFETVRYMPNGWVCQHVVDTTRRLAKAFRSYELEIWVKLTEAVTSSEGPFDCQRYKHDGSSWTADTTFTMSVWNPHKIFEAPSGGLFKAVWTISRNRLELAQGPCPDNNPPA